MGTITIVVVGLYSQKTAGVICTGVRSTITIQRGTLTDYIHSLLYATSIYICNIYIHLYTKLQHCQEQLHCSWQSLRKPSLTDCTESEVEFCDFLISLVTEEHPLQSPYPASSAECSPTTICCPSYILFQSHTLHKENCSLYFFMQYGTAYGCPAVGTQNLA